MKKEPTKYPDDSEIEFSDGWIENQLKFRKKNPQIVHRRSYTDSRCMGLMCWFAKNNRDVTFSLRIRVKMRGFAEKQRVTPGIGTWVGQKGALNVARARSEANNKRSKFELEGYEVESVCPTLNLAISCEVPGEEGYEHFRRKGDPRTSRRRAKLPDSWPGHVKRFREIHAEYLERPVTALDYNTLLRLRDAYVKSRMDETDDEKAFELEARKIQSCYKTMMPMLKLWFRDHKGWIARDQQVELLVPKGYKKCSRYLYPGEWQAAIGALDTLDAEVPGAGLFPRLIFASGARTEATILMKWEHVNWDRPDKFRDEQGVEHEALVWLPPPETMKMRSEDDDDEKPCKLLITGYALDILKRLRAIYDANRKANPLDHYTGVFSREAVAVWRNQRSTRQRAIEKQAGTARWNRKVLRHTHATYLEFLGCPPALITQTLTHTPSEAGAAAVTRVYTDADPVARFMKNEPLAALGPWHLRLHQLMRDMEEGNDQGDDLLAITESLVRGQRSRNMRTRYNVDVAFIHVQPRVKVPRLRIVG